MFKKRKAKRLIERLTGLVAKKDELRKILDINEKVPTFYIDQYLDLCQEVAELQFKIEMIRDGK